MRQAAGFKLDRQRLVQRRVAQRALANQRAGAVGNAKAAAYYIKFGIYRSKWRRSGEPADEPISIRYANLRFGTEDLSSRIANPDPEPIWEAWP